MNLHGVVPLAMSISALALIQPVTASADGLPATGVDASRVGVTDGAGSRYVTIAAGRDTVVARTEVRGGQLDATTLLRGNLTIPAVAYDGSASGLSADGRTLVLIKPRVAFPRKRTTFAVIDTRRLELREVIDLKGDFSFDAISPDGNTMYLIRYLSPRNLTRYAVRAYDLVAGRLLPGAIVDPEEPGERMAGVPMSRAASPDGRWAYTFYDGVGHEPFIHALDTVDKRAVCIDLPQLEGRNDIGLLRMEVGPGGDQLTVLSRSPANPKSRPLVTVDTRSFEVRETTPRSSGRAVETEETGPPWTLIGVALGGLALLIAALGGAAAHGSPSRGGSSVAPQELPKDPEVLEPLARK